MKRVCWDTRMRTFWSTPSWMPCWGGGTGRHRRAFPDSDPRYEGARQPGLLREVCRILREAGFEPGNVDATIVAQAPKLAPYIPAMRRNIAAAMGLDTSCVSVKATTEERLGFTGEGLGIAAQAAALIDG